MVNRAGAAPANGGPSTRTRPLTRFFKSRSPVAEITKQLQRQSSAIRSRLAKLGLADGDA